ncbi:MAG: DnaJ family domain-containing protein [Burkholderiales bacterium]
MRAPTTKRPLSRTPPRSPLDEMVEERIRAAQRQGSFDNLPGEGKPLALDDEPLVPAEVRGIYRVLKNAGFVPQEVLDRSEATRLESAYLALADNDERKRKALMRVALLRERAKHRR